MKSALEVYEKFLNAITKAVGVIAGILLLLPALMVFYEVVMRGLFNAPTEWSIELSVYCVLVAGFLGMSVTYAAGKHIHVDIVLSHLSARTRCYIELFTTIVGIFFCAVFVMQSLDMALLSYEMDNTSPSTLRTPMWIPQMSLPIGMGLLLLQFVRTLLIDIQKISSGEFSKEAEYDACYFYRYLTGTFGFGTAGSLLTGNGGTFRYVCFYGRRIFFGPDTDFGLQIFG